MKSTAETIRQRAFPWIILGLLFVSVSVPQSGAETLWDSDFKGYVSDGSSLKIGSVLIVRITPSSNLSLTASQIDSNEGRLSFEGGEGGELFDFLPRVSSSASTEREEESSYELQARVAARILRSDEAGLLYLEGERSISINGKEERLLVSGWFSPQQVGDDASLSFDTLHNARLEYESPGLERQEILSEDDVRESEQAKQGTGSAMPTVEREEGPAATEAEAVEGGAAARSTAEEAELGAESAEAPQLELSEERQRELLLEYFNRFLNTIFIEK